MFSKTDTVRSLCISPCRPPYDLINWCPSLNFKDDTLTQPVEINLRRRNSSTASFCKIGQTFPFSAFYPSLTISISEVISDFVTATSVLH
jgi:hypothetical protein